MISLVDLDISIMDQMESIREKVKDNTNAKTFISGYMWAKPMDIKVHLEDDMYAMKNNSHGETAWNFPVGEDKSKISFIDRLIQTKGLKLLKLTDDDVDFLNIHFPNMFTVEEAVDDSEYVYDAVEHEGKAGKQFANLRRVINKFDRQHCIRTELLTDLNMHTAENIMMTWGNVHEARGEMNTSGIEVDRFIIEHYDELGMIGTLTHIDSTPSAVVIGYQISHNICDIAEIKFVPNITDIGYIAVEEFMKAFGKTYRYFNIEEDMGIEGLREYKMRMKPCKMNTLWNAYMKGDNCQ